jgi:hypothetical protein
MTKEHRGGGGMKRKENNDDVWEQSVEEPGKLGGQVGHKIWGETSEDEVQKMAENLNFV